MPLRCEGNCEGTTLADGRMYSTEPTKYHDDWRFAWRCVTIPALPFARFPKSPQPRSPSICRYRWARGMSALSLSRVAVLSVLRRRAAEAEAHTIDALPCRSIVVG